MSENASPPSSSAEPATATGDKRLLPLFGVLVSVLIFGIALWFLHRELAELSRAAVEAYIRSIPVPALIASVIFAAGSYAVLTGYDATALRHLNHKLPYRQTALTSFMAYAVGNNVGIAALSGGSIRYRMYTLAGLSAPEIAQVVVFVSMTFVLGASGLLGIALLVMPDSQLGILKLSSMGVTAVGSLLLAVPFLYLTAALLRRAPLTIGSWRITVPVPKVALTQLLVAITDLLLGAATLYVLLEPMLPFGYLSFLGIYLLAIAAGLISSVPAGIGVFEAVLVAALPQVDLNALLGTIIIYRLIYYVLPLTLALLLLVWHEVRQHRRLIQRSVSLAGDWASGAAPQVLGVTVFLAGVVLLVSGAIPPIETRLNIIARGIPLPVLELSHLLGSFVGVGLLILARGLYRRLQTAYLTSALFLILGIVFSLLKGLDYEESTILAAILLMLWYSRGEFYRVGSVADQRFSAQWIAAIVLVLGLAVWLGMISFRNVAYSNQLWWQFALDAEAPRMIRASVVAAATALAFALWKVLRGGLTGPATAVPVNEAERVRAIVSGALDASANIALLGDKRFLWSADQQAFIMYQVSGRSWIALGDPVGPVDHHEDLVWAFRELVDRHDGRPVFYQVSDRSLAIYVDLGLTLVKLGEDGRVALDGFSLQGSHRADLRQAVSRANKSGAQFEIVPRSAMPDILPELRRVSDSWLADKSTAEKGFSLGSFSEAYLANFDCAVVRVDGAVVAFANLWPAPSGGELSIDLMRYDGNAPKGVMDYLFAQLMLWGSANGYHWFSLGMAPLSGLEGRSLAPLWHKIGNFVFTHGEDFYNFEGLRNYKQKFEPQWEPRYLACPGGWWSLPRALLDCSRLISGGIAGILGK